MNIRQILEEFSSYEDIKPSAKMVEAGKKIKEIFEKLIKELDINSEITFDERPILKQDIGDDYPVVSICILGENEDLLQGHVYPKDANNIDGDLVFGLYSDVAIVDEEYSDLIEFEKDAKEVLKKIVEK